MKIIISSLIVLLIAGILIVPFASAQTLYPQQRPVVGTSSATQSPRVIRLMNKAKKEIDRRIESLMKVLVRINSMRRVPATQRENFTTKIQAEIASLMNLRTIITALSDIDTLKQNVQSIVTEYRVYVLLIPQIHLLAAADAVSEAVEQLNDLYTKLQSRIITAEAAGNNVDSLKVALSDMQKNMTNASTLSEEVISLVLDVSPEGYPANKKVLETARGKLKTAREHLRTSRQNTETIRKALKAMKKTTATPGSATSSSESLPVVSPGTP